MMGIEIKGLGSLQTDCTLIEADIGLLFIMKNEKGERYLFLCEDDNPSYLVVKVSVSDIKNLMNNKITMKSIFEERDDCYWVSYQDDIFTSTEIESELQPQFLPEDGCYLGRLTEAQKKYLDRLDCIDVSTVLYFCSYKGKFRRTGALKRGRAVKGIQYQGYCPQEYIYDYC